MVPLAEASSQPIITQHPHSVTVVRNEPVTLDCRSKSSTSEPLTIEWYKDGQLVETTATNPGSHRILLPDGSLFFLRVVQSKREQDGGVYWCVASDESGVARSRNATLSVACKYSMKSVHKLMFRI